MASGLKVTGSFSQGAGGLRTALPANMRASRAHYCAPGRGGKRVRDSAGEFGVRLVGGGRLAGDGDVRRREQEHLVGDALDLPVEALGEAAREVDEAAGVGLAHLGEVD